MKLLSKKTAEQGGLQAAPMGGGEYTVYELNKGIL